MLDECQCVHWTWKYLQYLQIHILWRNYDDSASDCCAFQFRFENSVGLLRAQPAQHSTTRNYIYIIFINLLCSQSPFRLLIFFVFLFLTLFHLLSWKIVCVMCWWFICLYNFWNLSIILLCNEDDNERINTGTSRILFTYFNFFLICLSIYKRSEHQACRTPNTHFVCVCVCIDSYRIHLVASCHNGSIKTNVRKCKNLKERKKKRKTDPNKVV